MTILVEIMSYSKFDNIYWCWSVSENFFPQDEVTCFCLFTAGFIPVCSLGVRQIGRMNFGKDVSTLKYFTICGLQEGYEPFAVNMNRDLTMWLSKRLPQFIPVPSNHEHIEVSHSGLQPPYVSICCVSDSTITSLNQHWKTKGCSTKPLCKTELCQMGPLCHIKPQS